MSSQEKIRESVNGVIAYLKEHPEEARGPGKKVTAVLEEGLRCRAESEEGFPLFQICQVQLAVVHLHPHQDAS